jgi:hypothetical protein
MIATWLKYNTSLKSNDDGESLSAKTRLLRAERDLFETYAKHYQSEWHTNLERTFYLDWVQSQLTENDLFCSISEEKICESIAKYQTMKSDEEKLAAKIIKFYSGKIQEMQDDAAQMSAEYDMQIEENELRYQIVTNERRRFDQMKENEEKFYENRAKEISDYLAMRQKKAADKALKILQETKATFIQAWWRGTMVRHFLGPFKSFKKRALKIRKEMRQARAGKNKKNQARK